MNRWLLTAMAVILVACGQPPETAFHLLRSGDGKSQVADLAGIRTDQDGLRRLTLISVRRIPFRGPTGDLVQFTRTHYAFDCPGRRYRGEGLVAYGPDFSLVEELKDRSGWAPVTDDRGLAEDFAMVCSSDPSMAVLPRLEASNWMDAARAALMRLEAEAGA